VAKRKAAELPIVQEQLARHKQLWREAESHQTQLQARQWVMLHLATP